MKPGQIKAVLSKLNPTLNRALENAASMCIQRTHYEITVEHTFLVLLGETSSDLYKCFTKLSIDPEAARTELERGLTALRTGNGAKPKFSRFLLTAITEAWNFANLERGDEEIRSSSLLIALIRDGQWIASSNYTFLNRLHEEEVVHHLDELTLGSDEGEAHGTPTTPDTTTPTEGSGSGSLEAFTVNLVARAAAGEIDPVIGREREIIQVVDILSRRRKNNPILVGEPGVGKSAIVEGLALMIAEGKAPPVLAGTEIRTLDLGLLKAGASMKGEFEERVKRVIRSVKNATTPIVLFIDEAHTLIGAGGTAGSTDAANLLKPALARGSLRTVAATTWAEYKKYIEKDAALERRFQVVKVEEPSPELATTMLRGLKKKYSEHHGVEILDSALETAASLSDRYITGRQLPDKAIDLLDTACARVRLALDSPPFELIQLETRIHQLKQASEGMQEEHRLTGARLQGANNRKELEKLETEYTALNERWQQEQTLVRELRELEAREANEAELRQKQNEYAEFAGEQPLLEYRVTPATICEIVSLWTGVPVGRLLHDTVGDLLALAERLQQRVLGQDHAAARIARAIQVSKTHINNPDAPIGAFLCVGPSGTGKTEMALALAEQLFGGERYTIQVNMSEYQEKHTLSRLIGSPPGYVGYGEGGVLTEAVRQRPYSVVLLDEVEKGHPDVMNLFYQIFDKGYCADGEGRQIDFKNTVVMMTSNLGSSITEELCSEEPWPVSEELLEALRPELNQYFKPALLARMTVIPYYPISDKVMKRIVGLKLRKIAMRLKAAHGTALSVEPAVIGHIAQRCRLVEAGARNIDHILDGELLPKIAEAVLRYLLEGEVPPMLKILLVDESFSLEFSS